MSEYSIYEQILSYLSVYCSFGIKEDYSDELIKENWIKLQKNYPYLYNYESIKGNKEYTYSDNLPIKYELQFKGDQTKEYLTELINLLSKESLKPERLSKKNSILAFSKIKINNINITLFSLYTPHARTDFKGLSFFVTSFLNSFDNISTIYPMESMSGILFEKNLIPDVKERQDMIKKYFNYKQTLLFDFSKFKENIKLTDEEKNIIKNQQNDINNQNNYLISETIKLNINDINSILEKCKKNNLSLQALIYAVYLKASMELFENNIIKADVVNFQIIYDQRKLTVNNEKCIGLFAEGTYPYLPIDMMNKSIIDISKELTKHIRKINSLNDEEFKRYRIECYYFHKELYTIQYTLSATNMGKFKVLDDLSDNIKNKFIDYYFLNGLRYPVDSNYGKTEIHMYSLFDGTCNISLSYPKHNISSVNIQKLLDRIKAILLNL